ncbi:MAG: hypothetical protein ACD_3C00051G0005 [uncultured bacterium (gcode 4)]|uniref:Uncharacterized protein n=1 Tax=uncultured bacterium (gcode 4) TaxID=1234023 RepID=K2G2L4_9BACT|nr:MAG: hypothetical protein ACD_3C00051G0005 [uncultured bacterium (gcode 4)]
MKKIISLSLAIFLSYSFAVDSAISAEPSLPWKSAVLECLQKASKLHIDSESIKEISWISNPLDSRKNLACKWWRYLEDYLYQSTVDVLFTEIDIKVEKYLKSLEWTKEPISALNDLQKKFWLSWEVWSFNQSYSNVCKEKALIYMIEIAKENKTSISTENISFKSSCEVVYKLKLQSYYDAWEVIIARETVKWYQNSKKTFMTTIKDKYKDLLFKLTIYLGQLKVIDAKWYTNTKNPQ